MEKAWPGLIKIIIKQMFTKLRFFITKLYQITQTSFSFNEKFVYCVYLLEPYVLAS